MTDADAVVQSFYGRWATLYDRIATLPPAASWRERTATSLDLDRGDTVVEMGCGTGANLPFLREQVGEAGSVIGLDLTREMLLRAREGGREGAGLLQADATRPPLVRGIDALLGTFVVGLFDDPAAVVDAWCDLVGPGGRVGLLHFHASDRSWARPANGVYRTLVRVASPNALQAAGAAARHDGKVREAEDALVERAETVEHQAFAGGFLRLAVGRMPGSAP